MSTNNNYPVREHYEDEIDLIELIKILLKNLKLIIAVTSIVTVLGIGSGYYLRSKEPIHMEQAFSINTFQNIEGIEGVKVDPKEIFNNNEILEEIFDKELTKELFEVEKKLTLKEKRNALSKALEITSLDKEGKEYRINVGNEKVEENKGLVDIYFRELNTYIGKVNKERFEKKSKILGEKIKEYEQVLGKIEIEVKELVDEYVDKRKEELSVADIIQAIKEKNPKIFAEKDTYSEFYNTTLKEKLYIDRILGEMDSNITLRSSLYEIDSKIKMKLIAIISFVLGGFLGIFLVFMKEFIKNVDWKN